MNDKTSITVTAETKSLPDIHQFLEKAAVDAGMGPDGIYDVRLAVEEAVVNIISHGYRGVIGKIKIEVGQEGEILLIRLRDEAMPFNPMELPEPDLDKPLFERKLGGVGVLLIRESVDEVRYQISEQGCNELTLIKRINEA